MPSITTASQTKRRPSIWGDFRQKQPVLQSLKRCVITRFLQFVTQSYYCVALNEAMLSGHLLLPTTSGASVPCRLGVKNDDELRTRNERMEYRADKLAEILDVMECKGTISNVKRSFGQLPTFPDRRWRLAPARGTGLSFTLGPACFGKGPARAHVMRPDFWPSGQTSQTRSQDRRCFFLSSARAENRSDSCPIRGHHPVHGLIGAVGYNRRRIPADHRCSAPILSPSLPNQL